MKKVISDQQIPQQDQNARHVYDQRIFGGLQSCESRWVGEEIPKYVTAQGHTLAPGDDVMQMMRAHQNMVAEETLPAGMDATDDHVPEPVQGEELGEKKIFDGGLGGYPGEGFAPRKRKRISCPPPIDGEWDVEKTYTPSDEMVYATTEAANPSDVEDFADIKDAIHVLRSPERTLVFAIAVDKEDRDANVMCAIRCRGGTPFGGYAYDRARDSYIVQCVDFVEVGNIPFSFMQTMDKVGTWQVRIPIPESVLEKHFTPYQRRVIAGYGKKYQSPKFEIQYIQMLGCH